MRKMFSKENSFQLSLGFRNRLNGIFSLASLNHQLMVFFSLSHCNKIVCVETTNQAIIKKKEKEAWNWIHGLTAHLHSMKPKSKRSPQEKSQVVNVVFFFDITYIIWSVIRRLVVFWSATITERIVSQDV